MGQNMINTEYVPPKYFCKQLVYKSIIVIFVELLNYFFHSSIVCLFIILNKKYSGDIIAEPLNNKACI